MHACTHIQYTHRTMTCRHKAWLLKADTIHTNILEVCMQTNTLLHTEHSTSNAWEDERTARERKRDREKARSISRTEQQQSVVKDA